MTMRRPFTRVLIATAMAGTLAGAVAWADSTVAILDGQISFACQTGAPSGSYIFTVRAYNTSFEQIGFFHGSLSPYRVTGGYDIPFAVMGISAADAPYYAPPPDIDCP